jgi:hypothetical protein
MKTYFFQCWIPHIQYEYNAGEYPVFHRREPDAAVLAAERHVDAVDRDMTAYLNRQPITVRVRNIATWRTRDVSVVCDIIPTYTGEIVSGEKEAAAA